VASSSGGKAHGLAVEDAQDQPLAEDGRHRAHPQVVGSVVHVDVDPGVLGQAALGDVHVAHDLQAVDDVCGQLGRGRLHLIERPVYAVADLQPVLERLEVDVRRLVPDGLKQDEVDHLDDGGGVLQGLQRCGGAVRHQGGEVVSLDGVGDAEGLLVKVPLPLALEHGEAHLIGEDVRVLAHALGYALAVGDGLRERGGGFIEPLAADLLAQERQGLEDGHARRQQSAEGTPEGDGVVRLRGARQREAAVAQALGDAPGDDVEHAASLARAGHQSDAVGEDRGMLAHRLGQAEAGGDVLDDRIRRGLELGALDARAGVLQGAGEGLPAVQILGDAAPERHVLLNAGGHGSAPFRMCPTGCGRLRSGRCWRPRRARAIRSTLRACSAAP